MHSLLTAAAWFLLALLVAQMLAACALPIARGDTGAKTFFLRTTLPIDFNQGRVK
jgi:hypothetical protein